MRRRWRDRSALVGGAAFAPIAIVVSHSLLDGFAAAGLGVILPEIRDAFGLSLSMLSVLGVATTLGVTVIGLPVAQRCDRSARVPIVAFGALAAVVATLVTGVAQAFLVFVVARVAFDVVLRVNDNAQASLLADYTPLEARSAVYYGRQIVASVGYLFGPLIFGVLAALFGWRAPVLFLAAPALLLGLASLRLPEPHRGGQERAAAGLTGDALEADDESVSFMEATRMLWAIPTIRLVQLSWLLLGGGLGALGVLGSLFLDEVLGFGPAARGGLAALGGLIGVGSMLYGARLSHRYLQSDRPERMFFLFAAGGVLAGLIIVLVAAVPNPVLVILGFGGLAAINGLVWPSYDTVGSNVMPARARTVGFAVRGVLGLPALLVVPLVSVVGDAYGLRWGMVASVPVFVAGGIVFAFAGPHYKADVARVINDSVATAVLEPEVAVPSTPFAGVLP